MQCISFVSVSHYVDQNIVPHVVLMLLDPYFQMWLVFNPKLESLKS